MTRPPAGSIQHNVDGGYDTARPTRAITPEDVAQRDAARADALAFLHRQGLADGPDSVAAILGLVEVPPVKRRKIAGSPKPCAECGKTFSPYTAAQETCSRSCGGKYGARTKAPQPLNNPGGMS